MSIQDLNAEEIRQAVLLEKRPELGNEAALRDRRV